MTPVKTIHQHPWLAAVVLFLGWSLALGAGTWTHLQSSYRDKIHQLKTEAKFRIGFVEYALLDSWQHLVSDTLAMGSSTLTAAALEANAPNHHSALAAMENFLLAFLEHKPIYHKVRLIDAQGWEVLTVRRKENRVFLMDEERLQNKKQRGYFQECSRLGAGEVHVSPFDLNQEYGAVEEPHLPTIRFCTPIHEAGQFRGIIVLSYDGNNLINLFKELSPTYTENMLLNDAGYWFHRTNRDGERFDFMFGGGHSVAREFPEVWGQLAETFETVAMTGDGLFIYRRFQPFHHDTVRFFPTLRLLAFQSPEAKTLQEYHWKILFRIPPTLLDEEQRQVFTWHMVFFLLSDLVGLMVCVLFGFWVHRRNAQREATNQILKLSRAVEQSPASIVISDPDGWIEYVNPAFLAVTGFLRQEVLGRNTRMLKSDRTPGHVHRELWATIKGGREWRGELQNRKKDGTLFWESATISPIRNTEGEVTHYLAIKEDITGERQAQEERRKLESQLRQAQKMEAIGHLTGGIAHDFNNMLAAIKGYSELALLRYATDPQSKLHSYLQNVLTACHRARDLIAQMLTFSRVQESRAQRLAIEPLVKEVVKLMRATLPSSISITQTIERTPEILIDPVQLHQVLMNLFVNARDAMAGKGRIDLKVYVEHGSATPLCSSCHAPFCTQELVVIALADDGPGIPTEIMDRVFDPFFTTKEVGQGTGMGLSVVHGILHSHQGHVVVRTAPGQGTEFQLHFPAAPTDKRERSTEEAGELPPPVIQGTFLVVDDEETVLGFLQEWLEEMGLSVVALSSGKRAFELFREHPHRFEVVITDQTMPEMTGLEMAQAMLAIRPGLPIILCTGYSREVDEARAREAGIQAFLKKPIEFNQLRKTLEDVMKVVQAR